MLRLLLAFLICLYSTASFGQINVNIEIKGVSGNLADNVRLFLSIEQQKDHALMSEARLHRLHKKAPQEIGNALQPFGYYRPIINAELTQTSPDHWQAIYNINPGPPLLIAQFELTISEEMKKDPEFQSLTRNLKLRKGDVLNQVKYENIKADLARLATERGYFSARFIEHRVEVDLDAYEARIHLHYEGGPRYRFGEVLLNQDVLDPDLLRRYIPFQIGAPYTLNELIDFQHALNDSDYFRTAEVSPGQPHPESGEIPITVALTPRNRHHFSFGLGYGTDTGARAKFGWEIPRLNRRGHRFNNEIKVSEIGYSVSVHYRVPVLNPRTDQMVYSAGEVNEKTDSSDSTVRTISASLNRNHGSWRESVFINFQQEEYIVADDRGISTLLIPGVNWSRTWASNFIYTIDGLRFDIGLRGANTILISDNNFFQAQGGIKGINPLGRRNRLIARGRLGGTWTDTFHELPSSVRFFAGGTQSVRGYAYQSLGPLDNSGEVVGGRYLMVGSIEYEYSFNGKWGLALFYDGGNAIDDIADDLEQGAGFGVRWQSPIGPVRFDLATAVTVEGRPWRLHINIGPDL